MTNPQTEAHAIARSVRGCTTDYQYVELVVLIATALAARDEELEKVKRDIEEFWKPQFDDQCGRAERAEADLAKAREASIETYYSRQIEWSRETFGPALRTGGVIDHIRKELIEIQAAPHDLSEWVDVIILAMDGFWRHGGTVDELMPRLLAKQEKNMARVWPDWRAMSENEAIEHDRSHDARRAQGGTE